jgi:hypothetical protein
VTVVVGIRGENGCLLAGDVMGSNYYGDQRRRQDVKTFTLSETVAIAYCGSYRLGQLIRFMQLPELPLGKDEYEWAVTWFIPAVRRTLKSGGYMEVADNVERLGNSAFLLAARNRLMCVQSDLQVSEDEFPWSAEGSGGEVAAGHLRGELGDTIDPVEDSRMLKIARDAVATSTDLNAFVGGKVTHVRTRRFTKDELEISKEVVRCLRPKRKTARRPKQDDVQPTDSTGLPPGKAGSDYPIQ